jgi:uncharacterized paraquat-inducible protein A
MPTLNNPNFFIVFFIIVVIIFIAILIGLYYHYKKEEVLCAWCKKAKTVNRDDNETPLCLNCAEELRLEKEEKYRCPFCAQRGEVITMKNLASGDSILRKCPIDGTIVLIPEDAEDLIGFLDPEISEPASSPA